MVTHQADNSKGNYNYNAFTYSKAHFAPHFHANFELIYMLYGTLVLTVGTRTETISKGEIALILPNQVHAMKGDDASLAFVAVFSSQFVPDFAKQMQDKEGEVSVFQCDEEMDRFLQESLIFSEPSLFLKKACLYAVCDMFVRKISIKCMESREKELLPTVVEYVAAHYREPISMRSLALELGYEYHYFSRLLHRRYHLDFSDLVNQYRVDHAIGLLESTDLSITDIALDSGFQSIRNFNHVFHTITGVAPSKYIPQKS
jgi:AraC-like DNA-binding protein/quercetin dioxygenase-like cupin family protein